MQTFPIAERCVDANGNLRILRLRRRKQYVKTGNTTREPHKMYGDYERVTEAGSAVKSNEDGTYTVIATGEILTFVEYCEWPMHPPATH